jgi:hypothetical protein
MTFIRQNNPLECNGMRMKTARLKRVQSSEKDERTDLSKKYKNGGNFRGIWLIFHKKQPARPRFFSPNALGCY